MRRVALALALCALAGCASAPKVTMATPVPVPPPLGPIEQLLTLLSSDEPKLRAATAWNLAGATEDREAVCTALRPLGSDPEEIVRYAARWTIDHLDPCSRAGGEPPGEVTLPKLLHKVRPEYPDDAFRSRIQGTVLVEILIGERGEVAHAEIRRSIAKLDAAALACARQWQFEPMRVDALPIATVANVPVTFRVLP